MTHLEKFQLSTQRHGLDKQAAFKAVGKGLGALWRGTKAGFGDVFGKGYSRLAPAGGKIGDDVIENAAKKITSKADAIEHWARGRTAQALGLPLDIMGSIRRMGGHGGMGPGSMWHRGNQAIFRGSVTGDIGAKAMKDLGISRAVRWPLGIGAAGLSTVPYLALTSPMHSLGSGLMEGSTFAGEQGAGRLAAEQAKALQNMSPSQRLKMAMGLMFSAPETRRNSYLEQLYKNNPTVAMNAASNLGLY
jgi:hypothetical protein